jgi:hypothetical protein
MDTNLDLDIMGFRPYDEAVSRFLTVTLRPDTADPNVQLIVRPVMAGMQKEFSDQASIDPKASKSKNIKDDKTVKLPASSLSRLGWELDLTRWSRAPYRMIKWSEEGDRVMQSARPLPFEVMYQLDLWTKYRSTMNQFIRQVAVKFVHREVWLSVNTGGAFGVKRVPLKLAFGGPQDLTDLELDENTDRTIRAAFTFNMDAWVFPDVEMIPTVRKVIINSYGSNNDLSLLPTEAQEAIKSLDLLSVSKY